MLGSWSFGRYFKEGAIEYATEFIQDRLKLDWDRIWPTRARRRSRARPRPRRGGDPRCGRRSGIPAERITPLPSVGELLVGRRPGPVRPRLGDLLRLGRGGGLRRARLRARLHAVRALPRVLEPRLHGVRAPPGRHADAAPRAEHRHGSRSGAHRADRPAGAVGLRHGRLPDDHGAGSSSSRASRTATRRTRRRRTACSPTTRAG